MTTAVWPQNYTFIRVLYQMIHVEKVNHFKVYILCAIIRLHILVVKTAHMIDIWVYNNAGYLVSSFDLGVNICQLVVQCVCLRVSLLVCLLDCLSQCVVHLSSL